jgi:hypothetical protein
MRDPIFVLAMLCLFTAVSEWLVRTDSQDVPGPAQATRRVFAALSRSKVA